MNELNMKVLSVTSGSCQVMSLVKKGKKKAFRQEEMTVMLLTLTGVCLFMELNGLFRSSVAKLLIERQSQYR